MLLLMQVFAFGACDSGETQKDVGSAAENTVITISDIGYYHYVISNTTTFTHIKEPYQNWFIFCSSSASALRVKSESGDRDLNLTSPPFAYGHNLADYYYLTPDRFTVETEVTTDVIVFVLSYKSCVSGAYLLAGGTTVEMKAVGNFTSDSSSLPYCVFSPSTDGQEVEVTYGVSRYIDTKQWAELVYFTDFHHDVNENVWSRSLRRKGCMYTGICKERVESAAFYVEYMAWPNSSDEMSYSRKNLHGSDKFWGCTDAQIPYSYTRYTYHVPFDTFWATRDCDGHKSGPQNPSKIGVYVAIGIGCVTGLCVIIAALGLSCSAKARATFCGCFRRRQFTDSTEIDGEGALRRNLQME